MRKELTAIISACHDAGFTAEQQAECTVLYLERGLDMGLSGTGWFDDDPRMQAVLQEEEPAATYWRVIQQGLAAHQLPNTPWDCIDT